MECYNCNTSLDNQEFHYQCTECSQGLFCSKCEAIPSELPETDHDLPHILLKIKNTKYAPQVQKSPALITQEKGPQVPRMLDFRNSDLLNSPDTQLQAAPPVKITKMRMKSWRNRERIKKRDPKKS